MKKYKNILTLLLLIAAVSICKADDKKNALAIEQVIQVLDNPSDGYGSMSPFELQTYYRLMRVLYKTKYTYQEDHANLWLNCMHDKKRSMYARLCSAYFLLDQHEEARKFVISQLQSKNLRYRYNAAKITLMHVNRDPKKEWGVSILIQLLADGSIDGSGVTSSPPGKYPNGDRDDIMMTPINNICWHLGYMKEKKAVPALISVLERQPKTGGAAFALGEIGDNRAIPILMKVLNDRSGYEDREVTALGKLKHKAAVPILTARLGNPRTTFSGLDIVETEKILEALLEIGDEGAIEPIEKYLKNENPNKSKAVARRVLIQLKSDDPVDGLLALLDKEAYEPERSDIIFDLIKSPDNRVVRKLADIAGTSDSAFMRREAIIGLGNIANRDSLLALASLLDATYPQDLKAKWGWKIKPDFQKYFPETIEMCLKNCTKQDFGKDKMKWKDWIMKNIEPMSTLEK